MNPPVEASLRRETIGPFAPRERSAINRHPSPPLESSFVRPILKMSTSVHNFGDACRHWKRGLRHGTLTLGSSARTAPTSLAGSTPFALTHSDRFAGR